MPTVLYPQDSGFCAPIFRSMDDLFGRTTLLNSATGTLNAILSDVNQSNVDLSIVDRGTGRKPQYRFQFKKRTACPTDFGACIDFEAEDLCAPSDVTTPDISEWVWDGDGMCTKKVWEGSYDLSYDETHCAEDLAMTMARAIDEAVQNYAIALNGYLWQQLSQPYTADVSADPCVSSEQFGVGKCGWLDINQVYHPSSDPIVFEVMNSVGAIFPFFSENWGNLLAANNIVNAPIVVHGNGALKTYLKFLNDGVYSCCSDDGVDQAALARRFGMFAFEEGRPTANRNAGVSQDTTLIWEPGAHLMIQPYLLGQPLQAVSDQAHQRYQFVDSRTGLQFLLIRNRRYCDTKVVDDYKIYHTFKLISKPCALTECIDSIPEGEGINQTLCVDFKRCQPIDCDGNPAWGPQGDPTVDLSTV